jgi:hypothetical protein
MASILVLATALLLTVLVVLIWRGARRITAVGDMNLTVSRQWLMAHQADER